MSLLSIIIPVYNAEEYLPRCIDSIINNTFPDWELILVDDGSLDHSGDICDSYSRSDERIKVLHQRNAGQSVARNNGLQHANGIYVTFVDADDEISVDAYLPNIQYLETHPDVDFLQYPTLWNCNTDDVKQELIEAKKLIGRENIFAAWCNNSPINYSVWNKIFRKELVNDIEFVSGRLYEDKLFLLDVIRKCQSVYLSSDGEYRYYQYPGSSINRPTFLRRISWVESEYALLKEMYKFPETSGQWLKRWMDTNRYLANTHTEYLLEDIQSHLDLMKQTLPLRKICLGKDYFWYIVIKYLGTGMFLRIYCLLLGAGQSAN